VQNLQPPTSEFQLEEREQVEPTRRPVRIAPPTAYHNVREKKDEPSLAEWAIDTAFGPEKEGYMWKDQLNQKPSAIGEWGKAALDPKTWTGWTVDAATEMIPGGAAIVGAKNAILEGATKIYHDTSRRDLGPMGGPARIENSIKAYLKENPDAATDVAKAMGIGAGVDVVAEVIIRNLMGPAGKAISWAGDQLYKIPGVRQVNEKLIPLFDRTARFGDAQMGRQVGQYIDEGSTLKGIWMRDVPDALSHREITDELRKYGMKPTHPLIYGGKGSKDHTILVQNHVFLGSFLRGIVKKQHGVISREMNRWVQHLTRHGTERMKPMRYSVRNWWKAYTPNRMTLDNAFWDNVQNVIRRQSKKEWDDAAAVANRARGRVGLDSKGLSHASRPGAGWANKKFKDADVENLVQRFQQRNGIDPADPDNINDHIVMMLQDHPHVKKMKDSQGRPLIPGAKNGKWTIKNLVIARDRLRGSIPAGADSSEMHKLYRGVNNTLEAMLDAADQRSIYRDLDKASDMFKSQRRTFGALRDEGVSYKSGVKEIIDAKYPEKAIRDVFFDPKTPYEDLKLLKDALERSGPEGRQVWNEMRGVYMQKMIDDFVDPHKVDYDKISSSFYNLVTQNPEKAKLLFDKDLPELTRFMSLIEGLRIQNVGLKQAAFEQIEQRAWKNWGRLAAVGLASMAGGFGFAGGYHALVLGGILGTAAIGSHTALRGLVHGMPGGFRIFNEGLEGLINTLGNKEVTNAHIQALRRIGAAYIKEHGLAMMGSPSPEWQRGEYLAKQKQWEEFDDVFDEETGEKDPYADVFSE